jgi:hypothetical protein
VGCTHDPWHGLTVGAGGHAAVVGEAVATVARLLVTKTVVQAVGVGCARCHGSIVGSHGTGTERTT